MGRLNQMKYDFGDTVEDKDTQKGKQVVYHAELPRKRGKLTLNLRRKGSKPFITVTVLSMINSGDNFIQKREAGFVIFPEELQSLINILINMQNILNMISKEKSISNIDSPEEPIEEGL